MIQVFLVQSKFLMENYYLLADHINKYLIHKNGDLLSDQIPDIYVHVL